MDHKDLHAQLLRANDMLQGALNQRTAALNECLQLAAALNEAQRGNADKDKRIAELEAQVKDLTAKANGADVAVA